MKYVLYLGIAIAAICFGDAKGYVPEPIHGWVQTAESSVGAMVLMFCLGWFLVQNDGVGTGDKCSGGPACQCNDCRRARRYGSR